MAKDLKNILLSEIEENKIKEKTPDKLPLNPTAEGWSGHQIRRFLAKSLVDNEGSFLSEFKNKMIEIKSQFEDVFGDGDGDIQGQIDSIVQDIVEIQDNDVSTLARIVSDNYNTLNDLKVSKTLTILDIDLEDDITLSEFKTALGDATTFANGLMSALDKENLEQTILDIQSLFSDKADKTDLDATDQTVADLQNNKVPKTTTIIGLDLEDNILIGEFRTALGNATQSVAGLLSAEDKTHLDGLVALLETDDDNKIVDTIGEILNIFQSYPEGADLVTALQGKVDKVEGKGLSTNDFTDDYKDKVDNQLTIGNLETQAGRGDYVETAYNHSQATHAPIDAQKNSDITKAEIEAKLKGEITSHSHPLPDHNHDTDYYKKSGTYSKTEIDQIKNDTIDYIDASDSLLSDRIDDVESNVTELQTEKQDKLVAGDNITIDTETNVISVSGQVPLEEHEVIINLQQNKADLIGGKVPLGQLPDFEKQKGLVISYTEPTDSHIEMWVKITGEEIKL